MKRIFFFTLVALVVMTTACDEEQDGLNKMTMTTQKASVNLGLAGSGTVTIDWGDKTEIQTHTIENFGNAWEINQTFFHEYAGTSAHTITITGESITHLTCGYNDLSHLDVSKNKALQYLSCIFNSLTQLDVSKNTKLTLLSCLGNKLTSLDVGTLTELTSLSCQTNQLSRLDLSNNIKLKKLDCGPNQLKNIDLSRNTELTELLCGDNKIERLDLRNNTKLTSVTCDTNQLTELNVSGLAQLVYLHCGRWINYKEGPGNLLTKLDLTGCTSLSYLDCGYNLLSREAMNASFETLNDTMISSGKILLISENPGSNDCDKSIAENKGWMVTSLSN